MGLTIEYRCYMIIIEYVSLILSAVYTKWSKYDILLRNCTMIANVYTDCLQYESSAYNEWRLFLLGKLSDTIGLMLIIETDLIRCFTLLCSYCPINIGLIHRNRESQASNHALYHHFCCHYHSNENTINPCLLIEIAILELSLINNMYSIDYRWLTCYTKDIIATDIGQIDHFHYSTTYD